MGSRRRCTERTGCPLTRVLVTSTAPSSVSLQRASLLLHQLPAAHSLSALVAPPPILFFSSLCFIHTLFAT